MRVGIIGLLHESNTFISQPTTLEHFRQNLLLTGDAIEQRMADTHHEVGGFYQALRAAQVDPVGILLARAVPFGTVSAQAFGALVDQILGELSAAGPIDGLLVAPHGATVAESQLDADGHWLSEVRRVAPDLPIVGTLDAHANLSPRMVAACDALISYRTNPHLDQLARGKEAAELLLRTLRGEVQPVMAAAYPPMAINIERQDTSEEPCKSLFALADQQRQTTGCLSNSILLGFPYADVPEMGSSTIAVTDNDAALAHRLADELATAMWQQRDAFRAQLIEVGEAIRLAQQKTGPVCLLDMGDNVGGGSPADGTVLAHALRDAEVPAVVCLYDPVSVDVARRVAVGDDVDLSAGARTDRLHGEPLQGRFRVVGFFDGKFHEPQPRHGGFTDCDQGPSVVVRDPAGLTVLLTSLRMPPFSLQQLLSCGIKPTDFQVLVAKGVNAPIAAYREVCADLIRVNTPGVTTADMTRLSYQHRRRPLHPFEQV